MPSSKAQAKYFSVAQANAALPLIRIIIRDITTLAEELKERHSRLQRLQEAGRLDSAHQEEVQSMVEEFERGQEKMAELIEELHTLNVEMKDPFSGLVDFPSMMDGRVVYLCWKQGEAEVAHWHELWAGFAGRQPLTPRCAKVAQGS